MLLAAVLLFSVVGISITHILPTWPTALAMVAVLTSVLACLYGLLFHLWVGAKPGASLARLASRDSGVMHVEIDGPGFRCSGVGTSSLGGYEFRATEGAATVGSSVC